MKILDLSAGKRAIWFDKDYRDALFIDARPEVEPDLVADSRKLPRAVGCDYDLVVFDPPHVNFSKNAEMSKTYGHYTTSEIRTLIQETAREAHRVTRLDALMAFKWNDHDQQLRKVLALMSQWWEPLFGHKVAFRYRADLKSGHRSISQPSSTTWTLLRRLPPDHSDNGASAPAD